MSMVLAHLLDALIAVTLLILLAAGIDLKLVVGSLLLLMILSCLCKAFGAAVRAALDAEGDKP